MPFGFQEVTVKALEIPVKGFGHLLRSSCSDAIAIPYDDGVGRNDKQLWLVSGTDKFWPSRKENVFC